METVTSITELEKARLRCESPVGFVPTMGFLHEGHLSLIRKARQDCKSVVTSIFVNPTQFSPQEDYEAYPRDLTRDLALLKQEGVDLVWMPNASQMYPPDFQTWVTVEKITQPLEGKYRPEHFRGVTTVVVKLFNCVQPHRAYFGQKDAQQAAVIQHMVKDLNYPITVVICPIIRENDGLAMSSRNIYLNTEQRKGATVLYRSLVAARKAYDEGFQQADHLRDIIIEMVEEEPLARIQYVSCANPDTLKEIHGQVERGLLSLAVFFGKTRLIDNVLIGD
jgi:pantoate--beta-alanine ligase